jgi:hypothetical protein
VACCLEGSKAQEANAVNTECTLASNGAVSVKGLVEGICKLRINYDRVESFQPHQGSAVDADCNTNGYEETF